MACEDLIPSWRAGLGRFRRCVNFLEQVCPQGQVLMFQKPCAISSLFLQLPAGGLRRERSAAVPVTMAAGTTLSSCDGNGTISPK